MLSFEKLTCFPVSSAPGGSRLSPLCSLVQVLCSAGCLLSPKTRSCINCSRIPELPYLLTVLEPPTRRGGEGCLDSREPGTSVWDAAQAVVSKVVGGRF